MSQGYRAQLPPTTQNRQEDAPFNDTGLTSAVERDRCKERRIAALLEVGEGMEGSTNERDESQGIRDTDGRGMGDPERERGGIARSWWRVDCR